jgi:hypothetical protein
MRTERITQQLLLALVAAGLVALPLAATAAPRTHGAPLLADLDLADLDGDAEVDERTRVTVETRTEVEDDDDGAGAALLSVSLGESVYFVDDNTAIRGPVTLAVTPSFGWEWLELDLGLLTTLEDLEDVPYHFTLRPGVRITPPIHVYARFAVPIQIARDFDYGFLVGVGGDIPVSDPVGLFVEVNTFFTDDGDWGRDQWPLEFRAGVRFFFG